MIEPNFNLLLWTILIMTCLSGLAKIVLGINGGEKDKRYDGMDTIVGIITLVLMGVVVFS